MQLKSDQFTQKQLQTTFYLVEIGAKGRRPPKPPTNRQQPPRLPQQPPRARQRPRRFWRSPPTTAKKLAVDRQRRQMRVLAVDRHDRGGCFHPKVNDFFNRRQPRRLSRSPPPTAAVPPMVGGCPTTANNRAAGVGGPAAVVGVTAAVVGGYAAVAGGRWRATAATAEQPRGGCSF